MGGLERRLELQLGRLPREGGGETERGHNNNQKKNNKKKPEREKAKGTGGSREQRKKEKPGDDRGKKQEAIVISLFTPASLWILCFTLHRSHIIQTCVNTSESPARTDASRRVWRGNKETGWLKVWPLNDGVVLTSTRTDFLAAS